MEIYLETLTDLLVESVGKEKQAVQIREDPHRGIYIEGLVEKVHR